MKIFNVSNIYFTLPYFFGNQLSHFSSMGYKIHLCCSPAEELAEFAELHSCRYTEILFSRHFNILADLKSLYKLVRYIRFNKFDVVTGHTPKAGMLAMLAAKICGVKKRIYFRHGLVYETASGVGRLILKWCERITSWCANDVVCVSPYLIQKSIDDRLTQRDKLRILNYGSCTGIDSDKTFNPTNILPEKKGNLRNSLNLREDNFVIGFTGRMVRDKGVVELVEAFKQIYEKNSSVRLLLVGPFEERDALPIETVIDIRSHPGIIHVGLILNEIQYYYSLMSIFVLPTHREGLGVALLEAQSMGVPALTTSHSGAKDAIIESVTGDFINNDSASIKKVIEEYITSPGLLKSRKSKAREFVRTRFNENAVWEAIENLYLQR